MKNPHANLFHRSALCIALGLSLATAAYAQSNTTGAVAGHAAPGDSITIENTNTGFSRTLTAGTDGGYRFSSLPTGQYTITRKGADGSSATRTASVSVGTAANVDFVAAGGALDTVTVVGTGINPIDVTSVESSTILTEETLDRLPVARDVTSVSLLAPGTTLGDSAFGNLASFGGATVGENAFYLNGFNITNFNNGLGSSTVPFEFISEQQVKTGGYGAEFGRATGGVVNIVSKRGSNEWRFGANAYWEPESLQENPPDVYRRDGALMLFNSKDQVDRTRANVYAGGPIVKDRLFFFALGEFRKSKGEQYGLTTYSDQEADNPFYALKLDWFISDDHLLEYTGFRDHNEAVSRDFNYTQATDTVGASIGTFTNITGGDTHILKYTGYLTDNFTLSALYGRGQLENTTSGGSADDCPFIIDRRSGTSIRRGCAVQQLAQALDDERTAYRIDAEWQLGDHLLRFGYDNEERTSEFNQRSSGGAVYVLFPNATVQRRTIRNVGNFETISRAYYLEDNWQATDNLRLSLGLRNEYFDNKNVDGTSFIEVKNQWAPRLGFSWDVYGDSTFKVFGNAGRYHLPVVNNTNIRLAGGEYFVDDFFELDGVNADFTPVLGEFIRTNVVSNGVAKDVRTIVDNDIDPMYQDEFILGFQKQFGDNWSFGVRAIMRDLKSTMEDIAIDQALTRYVEQNGIGTPLMDCDGDGTGDTIDCNYFVLANPNQPISLYYDIDHDGDLDPIELTAAQLGFPDSKRKYQALEFFWERGWRDDWFLQGSYTYAKSRGNNEGFVRSDNGQNDAGLTTNFDQPGLLDGGYGYLPNDRRHTLKLFGAYKVAEDWMVSGNFLLQSGRPRNCFGQHPTDLSAYQYGSESFYCDLTDNGTYDPVLYSRGSLGRTPWIRSLDLGVEYRPAWAGDRFAVKVDVFNVLNTHKATEVREIGELDGAADFGGPVIQDPTFGLPTTFQQPRGVRLSVSYDW